MAEVKSPREIEDEILPVVEQLGFDIVESQVFLRKGTLHVRLVIFAQGGIGSQECTRVFKTLYPRLELLYDSRDIDLEISSPGVSRTFKGNHEFAIFLDHKVKVLVGEPGDWTRGIIRKVENDCVILDNQGSEETLPLGDIKKAQLLFEWGNGENK